MRIGFGLILTIVFYFIIGGDLISKIVGFLYPAFESLKALESKEGSDDKKWLTYWIIFALFILGEQIFAPVVLIIPFYFIIKTAFFIYLFLPNTNGSIVIFEKVVKPMFLKNRAKIDKFVNKGKEKLEGFVTKKD